MVPNLEAYFDTTFDSEEIDFLTTGAVLGELGVVSKSNTNGSIQCVTNVVALHIKIEDMDEAMARFKVKHDSLEARIWRSYGLRIGAALCPAQPAYQVSYTTLQCYLFLVKVFLNVLIVRKTSFGHLKKSVVYWNVQQFLLDQNLMN